MDSILYKIYNGDYEILQGQDKVLREVERSLYAEWNKVQRMFGDEFIERILELEDDRDDRRAFRYYRAGFRLGVRLMLEGLTSTTG